jgi:uncharacterized protein YndB with AHSA1/START domain
LREVKQRAEEHPMDKPSFVYVTYIESTPERVWHALTDADTTAAYWGHRNVSDWQVGSDWSHRRTDGSDIADVVGTVLEAEPFRRLVITFGEPERARADASRVAFTIDPHFDIVRLTVTHENLQTQADYDAIAAGWPAVLANLKSLLETGHVMPQAPWEMHEELRNAQMAKR